MTGKSFVEAFTAKYLEEEEEDETDFGADDGIVILCPKSKPGANTFLRQVVLDHQNITSAGKLKEIADKVRNVTELDLSANPLGSWNVVAAVEQILSDVQDREKKELRFSSSMLLIYLGLLFYSVLAGFPSVREVHLSLNEFSSIPTPSDGDPRFTSVKKLYFNDNMVTSWSEIAKLGQLFPNVENLLLVNNPLSGLTEDIGGHFACLKQLSTLDTNLSSWEDIDNFNHFPKLTEIQLRGIPLLKKLKEKESRQLVVARLPHVTKLNNSPISEPEREDAERAFIRKFMDSTEKPKRYEELSSVHKNVHRLAQVDMTVVTSATITIKYKEKTEKMTISTEQTYLQLLKTLASHFGVRRSKIRLLYWSVKGDSEIDVLDSRTNSLQWYNIRDGDEITLEDTVQKYAKYTFYFHISAHIHLQSQLRFVTPAFIYDLIIKRKSPTHTTFAEAFFAKYPEEDEMDSHCEIKQIVLSRKHIIGAGDCQEIADELQDVTELDVSHNALCCWTEVRVTDVGPIGE
ncbi:hypothetical protein BSL78_22719 [Apostichopus japonicus]|uniref:Tubulin-specific chaperone cofactor E-like protein n=1 Tax=Stichopus japonicus TaxID=307972 RepID=A0A2G8JXE1_STIJA|nr:hypothetical protein BSL78_22719 [Apostichopus japonicus]